MAKLMSPLAARDPAEPHRAATQLELFYDLVSVVAIAAAATGLHHAVVHGHAIDGLIYFAVGFFSIWWVWMNFTWFASAYDNQDAHYTISVFVMMFGALLMAVGIPGLFDTGQIASGFIGWIFMRVAMATLWWRAGIGDPKRRVTTRRYAFGLLILQAVWVSTWLFVPSSMLLLVAPFIVLAELLLPAFAERAGRTPWHRHHIIERHGLLNIIVLGEGIVVVGWALTRLLDADVFDPVLAAMAMSALVIICAMWWLYFDEDEHIALNQAGTAAYWAYGHWLIYASGAATAAGIGIVVDAYSGHSELSASGAIWWVAIPICVYITTLWWLFDVFSARWRSKWLLPLCAASILISAHFTNQVIVIAFVTVLFLSLRLISKRR